jgi:hypothetical protein
VVAISFVSSGGRVLLPSHELEVAKCDFDEVPPSVLSFFLQEYQQTDENDGAECKEIHDRNERHPDPKPLFRIGCFLKEVRIAGYVSLGDGIADNEKEEKGKDA